MPVQQATIRHSKFTNLCHVSCTPQLWTSDFSVASALGDSSHVQDLVLAVVLAAIAMMSKLVQETSNFVVIAHGMDISSASLILEAPASLQEHAIMLCRCFY